MSNTTEAHQYVEHYKNLELKRQVNTKIDIFKSFFYFHLKSCITCMKKLNKNSADEDGLNCLVVGTEDQHIYIIESEAFTILATVNDNKCFYC